MTNKTRAKLTTRVARSLVLLYDFTYAEVGLMFGMSRQRVHQIAQAPLDPPDIKEKKKPKTRRCVLCDRAFVPHKSRQKYCTKKCIKVAKKERLLQKSQWKIFNRDNFTCQYCGKNPTDDGVKLRIDHIRPKSKGGPRRSYNLVTACSDCNYEKFNHKIKKIREFKQRIKQARDSRMNSIIKGGEDDDG